MQRTIQFWQITQLDGKHLRFRFPAEQIVTALEAAKKAGRNRHCLCFDGVELIAHSAGIGPPPMIILDKVRRDDVPSVGDPEGNRTRLPLAEGSALLEPTYIAFLPGNTVAVLVNGSGPRPKRLADYLNHKFDTRITLEPVLRDNYDTILREMRISRIDIAIPADRVTRELVGGDWVEALDGAHKLAQNGIIRIGMSVGTAGTRESRSGTSRRFTKLASQLRRADGIEAFDTAKISGTMPDREDSKEIVNLVEDRLVERIELEPRKLRDSEKGVEYARQVLNQSAMGISKIWSKPDNLPEISIGPLNN